MKNLVIVTGYALLFFAVSFSGYASLQVVRTAHDTSLGRSVGENITERGQSRTVTCGASSSILSAAGDWQFRAFSNTSTSTVFIALGPTATSSMGIALASSTESRFVLDDNVPYRGRVSCVASSSSTIAVEEK